MITIEQLLESVNLHFEPGWVTQDYNGRVAIWETKPKLHSDSLAWCQGIYGAAFYTGLKLSEFDGKNWTECIYEVPRKENKTITIDQLLASVDLDFEPRFVTKDEDGEVDIWSERPNKGANGWWGGALGVCCETFDQQIAEFENKPWQKCIYEVPQNDKPVVKIEKLNLSKDSCLILWGKKINELIEAVNELNGVNNET